MNTTPTNLNVNDKVRVLRKADNDKWTESCKGVVVGFTYDRSDAPTFALVRTNQNGKLVEVPELLAINAPRSQVVRW